jgi:DNA modification methylase
LLFIELKGITDRSNVRKITIEDRVNRAVEIVGQNGAQWLLWCGLNKEGQILHKLIPGSELMEGSDSYQKKSSAIKRFQKGSIQVLITKPKIAGFGINFQNCHNMAFVGLSDSWESYYQCIRRCWRFGQTNPVKAVIVLSDAERAIYDNIQRKEFEAKKMTKELIEHAAKHEKNELEEVFVRDEYKEKESKGKNYTLLLGDSCTRLKEIENESVGLSVFSPPFGSLYTYSATERDLGNSNSTKQFFDHFQFIIEELKRVTMPGRNCCVHCQQLPTTKIYDGHIGMKDFRGELIRAFIKEGWIYHGEVCIDKDPQAQAIRTKSKCLMFATKKKDSAWLRSAFADYILVFRAPGDNRVPVKTDITNEDWILWARPIWYGIRESNTLRYQAARDEKDEKHICPLQLETIERCIRLWSNFGETILSPFAGIGSEGHVAIVHKRKFIGIELKESYYRVAARNLAAAEENIESQLTFDFMES